MNPDFWTSRWQKGEIGFHQSEVHAYLAAYWPSLRLEPGSDVLVPLCGKSRDMVWLAELGHRVIGVELSPVAVDAFFAECGLAPTTSVSGPFMIKTAGPYTIWCGDFFAFPADAARSVAAVYDRAALVAFPQDMQPAYVKKLTEITPPDSPIALVSLAFPIVEIAGPPFSTPLLQVAALFGATHTISIVENRDALESSQNLKDRGVTRLEEALYLLRRK